MANEALRLQRATRKFRDALFPFIDPIVGERAMALDAVNEELKETGLALAESDLTRELASERSRREGAEALLDRLATAAGERIAADGKIQRRTSLHDALAAYYRHVAENAKPSPIDASPVGGCATCGGKGLIHRDGRWLHCPEQHGSGLSPAPGGTK